jgi:hypothetical protein
MQPAESAEAARHDVTARDSQITLEDLAVGARFLARLPRLLRTPLGLDEAHQTVARRLERRGPAYVDHVRGAVYAQPANAYRALLRHAGCEAGDLERLVRTEGLEGALLALYRAGVYLTIDEFKGRRPVLRGSATFHIDPGRVRNPFSALHVPARSSGSRGTGTPVVFDLDFIRGCAADTALFLEARGGVQWVHADWEVPGGGSLFRLLKLASLGARPARWFSQVDAAAPGLHPRYRWSTRLLRSVGALCGVPLPRPQHVPVEDPRPIAEWIRELLARGHTPHLMSFASSIVRVCRVALAAGIDLAGARFTLMGEPVTAARLDVVRRAGAVGVSRYGTVECGPIGYGCLAPSTPDDVHVLRDLQAVIQPGSAARPDVPDRALLVTSLHPAAPFVLLNVAMGDAATMAERACGCPLERVGWTAHLDGIRSYEKLTAGGMTFLDADVVHVLEDVLPARFGGTPTDYQLVESEDVDGRPSLALLVHPRLGPLEADDVARTFLQAVGAGSGAERVMALAWRAADLVRIDRRAPLATRSGKILHLHFVRTPARDGGPGS